MMMFIINIRPLMDLYFFERKVSKTGLVIFNVCCLIVYFYLIFICWWD